MACHGYQAAHDDRGDGDGHQVRDGANTGSNGASVLDGLEVEWEIINGTACVIMLTSNKTSWIERDKNVHKHTHAEQRRV